MSEAVLTTLVILSAVLQGIYGAQRQRRLKSPQARVSIWRPVQRSLPPALPPVLGGVAGGAGGLQVGQAVVVARNNVVGLGSGAGAARQAYAAPAPVALKHGRTQPLPAPGKASGAGGVVPVHRTPNPLPFQAFSTCPDGHYGVHPLRRASQTQLQRTCFWDGCGKTWRELA